MNWNVPNGCVRPGNDTCQHTIVSIVSGLDNSVIAIETFVEQGERFISLHDIRFALDIYERRHGVATISGIARL